SRSYMYTEFPEFYVWLKKERVLRPRKRRFGGPISRIFSISPNQSEKCDFRKLLHHVSGATSLEDLRTVHGICYQIFKQGAIALNLL
ncbi:hypothetical protein BDB01DRAFT_688667, partial [Pilobolus umbonatus]